MTTDQIIHSHMESYDGETYKNFTSVGMFAVLLWSIRKIIFLELFGHKVKKVELFLNEYISNVDCYSELFSISPQEINYEHLSYEQKIQFVNSIPTTVLGYSNNPRELNFEIISQVVKKFFQPSQGVLDWKNKLYQSIDAKPEEVILVWARKTDKVIETQIPQVSKYIEVLKTLELKNKKIVVQTDDQMVKDHFKMSGLHFYEFKDIPKFDNGRAFHIGLSGVSEEQFNSRFGINKISYLQQMLAITQIAIEANHSIIYPGNPSTFIPIMGGQKNKCLLFLNSESYV